ncbi:MAG: SDR family oxidoreductase [Hyphomicrobium sp.]|uniref:SDR family NAD(P)-dependent oxidoreductase n=1 Tax=Hyphomicrobium sp. TaxID=82 RepID=UPI0039E303AB
MTGDKKVALVTGGTGGIGREINRRFVDAGYVVVAADMNVPPELSAKPAEDQPKGVWLYAMDVRDGGQVDSCVDFCASLGSLHVVVNCAGLLRHGLIEDVTDDALKTVWDVNIAGAARVCRAASPHLKAGASIINISSVTATIGRMRGGSMYGSSKAALEALTRYLAIELAPRGIRVNAIAPGFIAVLPMSASMRFIAHADNDQDALAWCIEQTPMARPGRADEIAGPVLFLASDDASYITGHVMMVDGGVTAA